MVRLDLKSEEAGELKALLGRDLLELRMEIACTDRKEFRDNLKKREQLIKDLLTRLERPED